MLVEFIVCGIMLKNKKLFFKNLITLLILQTFTQLRFTYEQESHPEEFFIPYVWQLALSERYRTFMFPLSKNKGFDSLFFWVMAPIIV